MEFRIHECPAARYLTSPLFEDLDGPVHAFGVRSKDGASSPSALDLLRALNQPHACTLELEQVHGAEVVTASSAVGFPRPADAVQTDCTTLVPTIRTADCVPILLWHKKGVMVSAIHAGWRGLEAEIIQAAVKAMLNHTQTGAEDLIAAVGPSIGPCCYEVGEELSDRFSAEFSQPGFSGKPHLDLWAITRHQLEKVGLRPPAWQTLIHVGRIRCRTTFPKLRSEPLLHEPCIDLAMSKRLEILLGGRG